MTATPGPAELVERARAHSRAAQVLVIAFAWLVGAYAAWLGGDYGLGLGSVVGFGLVGAYVLLQQPSARAVAARGCYLLAGLVLVTPVFLNLPVLTGGAPGVIDPAAMVFHPGTYAMALVFVALAAVLAAVGYGLGRRRAAGTEP
ncbi:MAG: hypothetical protein U5J98_01155 [Halobacteriales archaeon]|nr:hypothetical protein [Halobacteriales archaeon]